MSKTFSRLFFTLFVLLILPLSKASAATLTVNSNLDNGDGTCTVIKCTFRDAIANSQDGDTISFGTMTGSIPIKGNNVNINHSLNITGPGENNLTLNFASGGAYPGGDLVEYNGNFYGTTSMGGANNKGTLFEWNPTINAIITQFNFNKTNGAYPSGSLVLDSSGNFYGTTSGGGANDKGTLFKWNPSTNTITTQFDFNGANGANPSGSLVLDSSGNLYGTTSSGGDENGDGTLFEWNPTAGITAHFNFNGTNGSDPSGSLILNNGNFYGMTSRGGINGDGTLFEWNPTNGIIAHFDFSGANGADPFGSLVLSGGKFYGVASSGGEYTDGIIFEWDPTDSTDSAVTDLFNFGGYNGRYPNGSLVADSSGKLYGTTSMGGANSDGTLFEWDPADSAETPFTDLFDFNGATNGSGPSGSLVLDSSGNLYGTTYEDGAAGDGTLFEWNPSAGIITQFDLGVQTYINHTSGTLNISGLTIANAAYYPIYENGGTLSISNTKFVGNYGTYPLYISASDGGVTLSNDQFINNFAGAIIDKGGDLTINDSTFSGNSNEGGNGGAIYFDGGNLTITNSTFGNNSDGRESGAIYVNDDANSLNLTNNTFYNNTASSYGTLESYAATTNITNSTFDTISPVQDYAIYIDHASNVVNSVFYSVNDNNCDGSVTSLGHNIDSGSTCGFNASGDIANPALFTDLADFNNTNGAGPYSSLVPDGSGNFYGTTSRGGANGDGNIFKWNPSTNIITTQFDFNGTNGSGPYGSLVADSNGNFYGTTSGGGDANGDGTLFEWNPTAGITAHFNFNGTNGSGPYGSLIADSNGNFYGTTSSGGDANGDGTLFEWNPTNGITAHFNFNGTNGANPYGSLVLNGGKFYGTTYQGGVNSKGNMFKWDPTDLTTSAVTDLFDFSGTNGADPFGSLIADSNGNFYGTTSSGGDANNDGTLFKWNPSGGILAHFNFNGTNGAGPYSDLLEHNGKFYGTTSYGGDANGDGTLFEWNPTNGITAQFDLSSANSYPNSSLILINGNFYGTTSSGGDRNNDGAIFAWNPNSVPLFNPSTILDSAGLKDNGGPVETVALLAGSPAINAGDDTKAPSTDARGMARVGTSDIGAFEYQEVVSTIPTLSSITITTPATKLTYNVGDTLDITGLVVTGTYSDNSTQVESITTANISGFNSSVSAAGQVLTIAVDGKTTTYTINVLAATSSTPISSLLGSRSSSGGYLCRAGDRFNIMTGLPCPLFISTTTTTSANTLTTSATAASSCTITTTLKLGNKGSAVKCLQTLLSLHLDGFFGPKTKAAVILFQKINHLSPDGIAGKKTIHFLLLKKHP